MIDIKKEIFRAYDIRGIVDIDFDTEWVEKLGQACGTWFLKHGWNRAVIGHDCRHSSSAYQEAIARGLNASGIDVVFLGLVPTPAFYFAAKHLNFKAGVMITASHNPPEFNGFKIWGGETTIHSEQIQEIYSIMKSGKLSEGSGFCTAHNIIPSYSEALLSRIKITRPVKVVIDGGNGAGGLIAYDLLKRAGAEAIPLYCEPDGNFPNHHPDPVVEDNLTDLKKVVLKHKAEVGIGLDGDADRIGSVDEKGLFLSGDRLLAIYSRELLSRKPGETVIADVKCSHLLFEDIKKHHGTPLMAVTGHSFMKSKMIETGAGLGGEISGHIFFKDRFFGFDDGIYSALRLVEILSSSTTPLSQMLADWPKTYYTPELRIECPESIKFKVVETALNYFKTRYEVISIDGARILFPDGWALIRASNTQAALTLRFESTSEKGLEELRSVVEKPLQNWIAGKDLLNQEG